MEYFFIFLAVGCSSLQFIFTKLFAEQVEQTLETALSMLFFTGLLGAALFFAVNGFTLHFSTPSILLAVLFAVVMIPYYTLSFKALTLGSVAIYSKLFHLSFCCVCAIRCILVCVAVPKIVRLKVINILTKTHSCFVILPRVNAQS